MNERVEVGGGDGAWRRRERRAGWEEVEEEAGELRLDVAEGG